MARYLLPVVAPAASSSDAFVALLNAALATLLANRILAVDIVVTDTLPAYARTFQVMIDYEDGGAVMSAPYTISVLEAPSQDELVGASNSFVAANAAQFIAPVQYRYTNQLPNIQNRCLSFYIASVDAVNGATNYVAAGGGGGGGGGIAGTIAAQQVAVGSAPNTLAGSDQFTWNGTSLTMTVADATATTSPVVSLSRSRGTVGVPTVVQAGDTLGQFSAFGHTGAGYALGASLIATATEAWTPAATGSSLTAYATQVGTLTSTPVVGFEAGGAGTVGTYPTFNNRGITSTDLQIRLSAADFCASPLSTGFGRSIRTQVATGDSGQPIVAIGDMVSIFGSTSALQGMTAVGQDITVGNNCGSTVAIGNTINVTGVASAQGRNVAIGYDVTITQATGGKVVVMGAAVGVSAAASGMLVYGADCTGISGNNGIAIVRGGNGALVNLQSGILVGSSSGQVGNFGQTNVIGIGFLVTCAGDRAIAIGNSANASHANGIALGRGATTTATNQLMIGSVAQPIDAVVGFGNLSVNTAGKGLRIKSGADARIGTSTMVAGTIVVANTSVTANTRVFLSLDGGGAGAGVIRYAANPGVGFTITSSDITDTGTVAWMLVEST